MRFDYGGITTGYYDIEKIDDGFKFTYKSFDSVKEMTFDDYFFNEWLEQPVAYGAFEDGQLLGYVEGTIEQWNNRYRISNICIFNNDKRGNKVALVIIKSTCRERNLPLFSDRSKIVLGRVNTWIH